MSERNGRIQVCYISITYLRGSYILLLNLCSRFSGQHGLSDIFMLQDLVRALACYCARLEAGSAGSTLVEGLGGRLGGILGSGGILGVLGDGTQGLLPKDLRFPRGCYEPSLWFDIC